MADERQAYTSRTWQTGDVITKQALNNIEDEMGYVSAEINNAVTGTINSNKVNDTLARKLDSVVKYFPNTPNPDTDLEYVRMYAQPSTEGEVIVPTEEEYLKFKQNFVQPFTNKAYTAGSYVEYEDEIYKVTAAIAKNNSAADNAAAWEAILALDPSPIRKINVMQEVDNLINVYTNDSQLTSEQNRIWIQQTGETVQAPSMQDFVNFEGSMVPTYSASKNYAVGDYVYLPTGMANNTTNDYKIYRCKTVCSAAAWTTNSTNFTAAQVVSDLKGEISQLKSAVAVIGEKVPNLYDADEVVIGKNWAGGDAENRAYIQIPVTAGKTYTVVIPSNAVIPQVAVIQLNSAPSSLGSFYVTGGNRNTFTAVTNCVSIRIQFEGSTTLSASSFESYDVQVFEGSEEYFSAVDKIARSKLPIDRKYIFIGDSYCEGYNPDGNVTGWGERLKTAMGLTNDNCIIKYKGGTGFYHASDGKTFSTLLDEAGDGIDKTAITDIIVCGGWNDNSESVSNVYFNGVLALATKVATEYPNATLYVGMIGASNDADVKSRLQSVVLYSYQYGALRKNYRYLNMVEYALSEANLASDGIHPNADGQVEITLAIKQALETGCAGLPYRFYNTIKTN